MSTPPGYQRLNTKDDGKVAKSSVHETHDIIQFAAPIHVVDAGDPDPKIELTIMRLGKAEGECSFKYTTVDNSARAGDQYVHTEGEITLKHGEEDANIVVPIIDDPEWNATMEFAVLLKDAVGCELGLYLKKTRVKVIDSSVFPTPAFTSQKENMQNGDFKGIGEFSLFFGFCQLCTTVEWIKSLTALMMFFDQLKNAYKYMYLVLSIYMVDKVFDFKEDASDLLIPGNRLYTAYVVAGLIITPIVGFFILDHIMIYMNVGGRLRTWLAKSLFRKYMNYSSESQDGVALPEQIGALTGDVGDACEGYVTFVSMGRLIGKIGMAIFFTLQQNPDAWWAVVAIPSVMLIWGLCRTRPYIDALDNADEEDDGRTTFVNEALSKLPLIASYNQRPQINGLFAKRCVKLGAKLRPLKQVVLTNKFVPEALGPLMVSIYTAVGANLVLTGELKLGVYLATISVFGDICGSFSEMFGMVMSIISTFTGLKGITQHLNLSTDLDGMKNAFEEKEDITREKRKKIEREPGDHTPRVDLLPLEVVDVSYEIDNMLKGYPGEPDKKQLFKGLNFSSPQGKVVAVTGPSGSGRRTFLELLCMRRFPSKGTIFIPSHLRCVLVTRELYLLNLSLWENLVFGNKEGNNPYRVEKILRFFEMKQILQMCEEDLKKQKAAFDSGGKAVVDTDDEDDDDAEKKSFDQLRESEKAFIHLARAFVMNPEIIVMHRPFANFHGEHNVELIKKSIVDHRTCRGLMMNQESTHRRRPRTVIFSSDNKDVIEDTADIVWNLPRETGGRVRQSFGRDAKDLDAKDF